MRKAAGILLITYGVKAISFLVSSMSAGFIDYRFPWGLIVIIPAVFIITGGVFCLKRKYWEVCFASSICLLLFMIFNLNLLFPVPVESVLPESVPPPVTLIFPLWVHISLSLPWGTLPIILVCLAKKEWQKSQA
jgi:hypothetical protein